MNGMFARSGLNPALPRLILPMAVYADLLRYRELFANLFRRDFQAKYKGSVLGIAWSLVNPLVLLGVYLLVFGLLFTGQKIPHYPIYLLAGLSCWIFFAVSLQTAARSMVDSAELIKKVRFPRQLVAFSMVATQAVTYAVMMAVLLVLSLVFVPEARTTVWVALPLAVVFVGFVAGLALLVACLNVLFRDIEHVLAAALLPWFFLTPILWHVAGLPEKAQSHHVLLDVLRWGNPVTPPIYAVRDALWSGHLPRTADIVYLCVAALVALLLGALVFRRVDDRIAVAL
jgi:ABC-type polysaccharide/polyol phosphate export permease